MDHRRRAADFSHLIESSCSNPTDCGSALESETEEANSSTQVNNVASENNKAYDRDESSDSGSFKSTILAGQVAGSDSQRTLESSYQTARTTSVAGRVTSQDTSLDSCRRFEVPSVMNKAIIPEFIPQAELDLSQSTVDPRSSSELNKNIVSHSEKPSDESRDTNYNIKGDVDSKFTADDQPLQSRSHKLIPSTSRPCSDERRDLLSKLDNMLASSAEKPKNDYSIFRRLSQEYLYSPRTFTERLVTIIDESETGHAGADTSGVNLSRMTKEFRKLCKFIQDESMPAMAPSFCINSNFDIPQYPNDNVVADYEKSQQIVKSPPESPSVERTTPRSEHTKKIYRKTPLNIFKNTHRGIGRILSPGSPNSTRDFEYWEKHCEGLSNSPQLSAKKRPKSLRRSFSTSDISEEAKERLIKCEEQLRSLEDLTTAEYETFDSHRGHEAQQQKIEIPSSKIRNATPVTKDESEAHHLYAQSEEIDGDELSSSLRIEKELQRRRCFELLTLMQKFEDEAKDSNEEFPKTLERHGIDPDRALIKTISTCMDYINCSPGIRQSKRKEASSVDSGIDTRSFGRTLYASSKKSFGDATANNVHKQRRDSPAMYKNQKSRAATLLRGKSAVLGTGAKKKIDSKAASSDNLYKNSKEKSDESSPSVSPRRPRAYLRPSTKSLAYSKSPSREKRSPTFQIPFKTNLHKTQERKRPQQIHAKSHVAETLTAPSTTASHSPKSPRHKYFGDKLDCAPSITYRTRSPGATRLTPSFRPSPVLGKVSRELNKKIGDDKSPKKSPTSPQTSKSSKHKLFVTPGRTPGVDRKRKTKTYFPSMDEHIYPERSQRIMKSLHAPGLYRLGYETVISPISMYIHGTDVNLIHNIGERKNEMMLTPSKDKASEEKLKFKLASSRNSPLRGCRLFSDNKDSKSDDNDENIQKPEFALPKATYNPPAQVHTVNESPNHIRGARTRNLLQSMQNRVVIRHEGKRFGKYEDIVPDSYKSNSPTDTDMSIHVLKSAEKTNFMGRRRMP